MKKNTNKTPIQDRILEAAVRLFLEQGYEETSVSQILKEAQASRSSFYHYFHSKDELLFTIAYSYDDKYVKWFQDLPSEMHTVDKLKSFHTFVMETLNSSTHRPLFEALYSHQVSTPEFRHIINPRRKYFQILHLIIKEGILKQEIRHTLSCTELRNLVIYGQIGVTYSWLLEGCSFSLVDCSRDLMFPFYDSLIPKNS